MRLALVVALFITGCASSRAAMPTLAPFALAALPAPAQVLEQNHFARDRMGVGEPELREILAAPVFLEEHARIGVLPVRTGYAPDDGVPVEGAPATLTDALDGSGMFDPASEISTEWPTTSGTAGLRELAARYRTESAGVLEATLFDVKTEGKTALMHREMVRDAAKKLGEQVLLRCARLVATRPSAAAPVAQNDPSP